MANPLTELLDSLRAGDDRRFVFAALEDELGELGATDFVSSVESIGVQDLDPFSQNYIAAMVEQAAHKRSVPPPAWTRDVRPLDVPWFATRLSSLRLHLLRSSPVPFRRRNIFIDPGPYGRV